MTTKIHLGYEVGTGAAIAVPLKHMAVTGQTQESGKTTTLEALITRSNLRAIAFVTKRGESGFDSGRQTLPYFEDRADWEFVESMLEATMSQRMKFERAWVVRACKGAKDLAGVQRNVRELMERSKRSMDADMYMLLNEYLEKVVPQIALLPRTSGVNLQPGLNVINLLQYPEELQMLVIGATVRWIHKREENVVTLIPEAWKFVPQGRKTPVQLEVERLAREGAGLKNYIWIDSQDMAGVEKKVLRACAVWLIGVQREANEVERALGSIPKGIKRPKESDIAKLKLGEFYACWGEHIHKVYVQPAWMDEKTAVLIAQGKLLPPARPQPTTSNAGDDAMYKEQYEEEKRQRIALEEQIKKLNGLVQDLRAMIPASAGPISLAPPNTPANAAGAKTASAPKAPLNDIHSSLLDASVSGLDPVIVNQLYQVIKERLARECPPLLSVTKLVPEIEVSVKRDKIKMDTTTAQGRIALLIAEGIFDRGQRQKEVIDALNERGLATAQSSVSEALKNLVTLGFLTPTDGSGRYRSVQGMKVHILEAA